MSSSIPVLGGFFSSKETREKEKKRREDAIRQAEACWGGGGNSGFYICFTYSNSGFPWFSYLFSSSYLELFSTYKLGQEGIFRKIMTDPTEAPVGRMQGRAGTEGKEKKDGGGLIGGLGWW